MLKDVPYREGKSCDFVFRIVQYYPFKLSTEMEECTSSVAWRAMFSNHKMTVAVKREMKKGEKDFIILITL